jgi:hypothetical protein
MSLNNTFSDIVFSKPKKTKFLSLEKLKSPSFAYGCLKWKDGENLGFFFDFLEVTGMPKDGIESPLTVK